MTVRALSMTLSVDLVLLVALALAVRWPYLWDIPRFTDETDEALLGLQIARAQTLRLTNQDPYIGALWNYLLAAAFLLAGPSLFAPRLLVMALGALTVLPTYLLARSLGGRPVGLLAATFLALSPTHIAVNSHIAWSNSITPLFTTLALWLLYRSVTADRPSDLIWSGLAFGLGLQTHPTVLLLLPAAALYVLWARPAWLRSRWPYLAAGLAVLAYADVLVENLRHNLYGLQAARDVQIEYARGEALSALVYLRRLGSLVKLLGDSLGGVLSQNDSLVGPLGDPTVLSVFLVSLVGLGRLIRRGGWLPVLAMASVALLLPLVNPKYESAVPQARYLALLLPLCYLGIALALAEGFSAARRLGRRWPSLTRSTQVAVALLTLFLVFAPLSGLEQYYRGVQRDGLTNALLFQTIGTLQQAWRPGERLTLDSKLGEYSAGYYFGGGRMLGHLTFASAVFDWPRQVVEMPRPSAAKVPQILGPLAIHADDELLAKEVYWLDPVQGPLPSNRFVQVYRSSGPRPLEVRPPQTPLSAPPRAELVASGTRMPADLAFAPDGRLFFNEVLEGRVRILDGGVLQPEPFVVLPTTRGREQGALGLALDPSFAANHWVYVFYSEADADNRPLRNRVVRFTERDGRGTEPAAILGDLPVDKTLLNNGSHNGGRLAFGPDGKLFVSVGEVSRRNIVQDLDTLNGKLLRVNPDGSVPDDNPFPGYLAYAIGFRNVWGMAFNPANGQLYVTDNGPRGYDEVNLVLPGHNYAYPIIEGGKGGAPRYDDPFWDSGEERLGITGMTFYTGSLFPEYQGDLFFCACNTGALRRLRLGGPALDQVEQVELVSNDCRLDVADGPDGALYITDLANIYRLVR